MLRKNKAMMVTLSMLVGVTMFTATAFATIGNVSGYDALKKATVDTMLLGNYTCEMAIEMKLNNNPLETERAIYEVNGQNQYTVSTNSDGTVSEMFNENGTFVSRRGGGAYRSYSNHYGGRPMSEEITPTQIKFFDLFTDTLVGDIKNYVLTDGKTVTMRLEGNQIPQLAQLGIASIAEAYRTSLDHNQSARGHVALNEVNADTFLTLQDVAFDTVTVQGELGDDGYLKSIEGYVKVTARDNSGTINSIEANLSGKFTNVGTTVPKTTAELENAEIIDGNIETEFIEDTIEITFDNDSIENNDAIEITVDNDVIENNVDNNTEEPTADAPNTDELAAEEPIADAPTTEEEPAADEPNTDEPNSEEPNTEDDSERI